jgi:hypothetical protein
MQRPSSLESNELDQCGFFLIPGVVPPAQLDTLRLAVGDAPTAGRRGMLADPAVAALAYSEHLLTLVGPHLFASSLPPQLAPAPPRPVRAISFDKSPAANWYVAWRQDLTIAVAERRDVPGFGPWSVKNGVPHVQPPVGLLEHMLTVRLHLDPADATNGALRVLPGSHRHGRLRTEHIESLRHATPDILCRATAGDALLMRPLLLHASSRATAAARRRVLHIEYAACELPGGLSWRTAA